MKTQEFIVKTFDRTSSKERMCSSVYTDTKGNVYSYGDHYPLLFRVRNHVYVNRRGYSVTTAKHINWAYGACRELGLNPIGIDLPQNITGSTLRYNDTQALEKLLRKALAEKVIEIGKVIQGKKRKDTRVFETLVNDFVRADDSLKRALA